MLNGFAPDDGGGDRLRFLAVLGGIGFWSKLRLGSRRGVRLEDAREGEVSSSSDSKTSLSSILRLGGEGGRSSLAVAVWNGISVGEIYRPELDGPAAAPVSDNSSMGVIGGGGVNGGGGVVSALLNGDGGRFPVARAERFGRRDLCRERRAGDGESEERS